jgi:Uma2 family endonuclease
MSTATAMTKGLSSRRAPTVADLLHQLGDIPPERVRMQPPPGTATEQDVIDADARDNSHCELVDGVLVEKAMGFTEGRVAAVLIYLLEAFTTRVNLGIILSSDAAVRLMPGLVRVPDVSFVSWKRLPRKRLPTEPIPDLVPDFAVEVLSVSNTEREMQRKLGEYFQAGVRLVWLIDPETKTVEIYTSPSKCKTVHEDGTVTGGKVLPGFSLSLRKFFARVWKHA